jgi:hypothetical protein
MWAEEPGRVRESYNSRTDSMFGVVAGIVDAEKKRNPSLLEDGGWWDTASLWLMNKQFLGQHSWAHYAGNVHATCTDASPHPFCKSTAPAAWADNFRNLPLQLPVRGDGESS